jgi:hypothetical protein
MMARDAKRLERVEVIEGPADERSPFTDDELSTVGHCLTLKQRNLEDGVV